MIKENMLRFGNFIVEGQNSDKNSFLEEKIGNPTVSRVCWRSISSNVDFSDIKIENMQYENPVSDEAFDADGYEVYKSYGS